MIKPIVLIIRDGWGRAPEGPGNATTAANTPNINYYRKNHPHCLIGTSGHDVGLPDGSQGSSEVGHLNLGAGRIVEQEVVRIDRSIEKGDFFENPVLLKAVENCRKTGGALHLMGLVQDQGVHAMNTHLYALLRFAKQQGLEKVFIHFFSDGRDTPPQSALEFLEDLEAKIQEIGVGHIASVMGRFWAMDRDKQWERVQRAYDALTMGKGRCAKSAREAIEAAYMRIPKQREAYEKHSDAVVETDEFIVPTLMVDDEELPIGLIRDGDSVIHFNYRQDRAIQLTQAFAKDDFDNFKRLEKPKIYYAGLTRYYDSFDNFVLPPMNMDYILSQVLCENKKFQLRISETQKYRHVTSFFNSKRNEPDCYEDRILVKSSSIAEDKNPEMRAKEVTDLVLEALNKGIEAVRKLGDNTKDVKVTSAVCDDPDRLKDTYDVIVLNFANCDMVGHRGFFDAAVKAVEAVDKEVGRVVKAVLKKNGVALITADHGNVEQMKDPETGKVHTAHTTFPVECFYVANDTSDIKLVEKGILSDFAPTILKLLGIEIPKQMTRPTLFAE